MTNLGIISNTAGAFLYLFLLILLLVNWKGKLISFLLCGCAFISAVWFSAVAWHAGDGNITVETLRLLEFARDLGWLTLLILVIRYGRENRVLEKSDRLFITLFCSFILLFFFAVVLNRMLNLVSINTLGGISTVYFFYLVMSLFGLLLVEKLYQNTAPTRKWNIRYFCLGIGGIFVYDFYLYSDAMLLGSINPDLWYARGVINALCVPLIIISIVRNPQWEANLFVSRHVVYRSVVVIAAGIYLSIMAAAGYYVREFGGTWGSSLQIAFFFGALIVLFVVLFSSQFRSALKVILAKHFYKNKYDYREEWLNFTRSLAEVPGKGKEHRHVIRTIANIVGCKGGGLWMFSESRNIYEIIDAWNSFPNIKNSINSGDEIIYF
ncbi:MAG: PEP-CTERM system histidine kinase PrsK, partial [Thiotrichales bacterium]|nr:PEP-CTERM system histidine kinase PrsK [Thiotrichales bacterium]